MIDSSSQAPETPPTRVPKEARNGAPAPVPWIIRPCTADDAETLVELIRELARYEHLEAFAQATPDALRTHLFGPRPSAAVILAEVEGKPAGFALYFTTFSTFRGQPGIYVEDLYVRPGHRGRGIGKALMATLARSVAAQGGGRLEWAVLNWNVPAIGFYESLGARPLDAWTVYRLDGPLLDQLAEPAPAELPTIESDLALDPTPFNDTDSGTTAG